MIAVAAGYSARPNWFSAKRTRQVRLGELLEHLAQVHMPSRSWLACQRRPLAPAALRLLPRADLRPAPPRYAATISSLNARRAG